MKKQVAVRLSFCPTGPGGGIDNSCGKGEGDAKAPESARDIVKMQFAIRDEVPRNYRYTLDEKYGEKSTFDTPDKDIERIQTTVPQGQAVYGTGRNPKTIGSQILGLKAAYRLIADKSVHQSHRDRAAQWFSKYMSKKSALSLSFCPTGPGGGIDPSCSRDGSGGRDSADRASERANKATADQPKQRGADGYADSHARAGELHTKAAERQRAAGNHERAKAHEAAAFDHNEKATGKPLTPTSHSAAAKEASIKALANPESKDAHERAAERESNHKAAADAHKAAAESHRAAGNHVHAAAHDNSAKEHSKLGKLFGAAKEAVAASKKVASLANVQSSGKGGRGGGGRGGGGGGGSSRKKKKKK